MSYVPEILALSELPSTEIAKIVGCSPRYVRRVLLRHNLSHPVGAPRGERNPSWVGGRMVGLDGYVLTQTKPCRVSEHRSVMEQILGRNLQEGEVVDHINGITIHNDPDNLRLFASNGEHLSATITGVKRNWSESGLANIGVRTDLGVSLEPVDTYRRRRERGDVRLRAILRASLELGITHPCLLGTTHWLVQRGIDPKSYRSLERAWRELQNRYEQDLAL